MTQTESERQRREAYKYLDRIQRGAYERLGIKPQWKTVERDEFFDDFTLKFFNQFGGNGQDLEAFRQETFASMRGDGMEELLEFQNPMLMQLMQSLTGEIEAVLGRRDIQCEPKPVFGTLPTGRVNGMAMGVPNTSQAIVLIEDGLFGFANLLAKAVSKAFPLKQSDGEGVHFSTDPTDLARQVETNPEIFERFIDVLLAYVIVGHPHAAKPYLPERNYSLLSDGVRDAMELFIVGHEYAHFILGHLESNTDDGGQFGDVGPEERELLLNWQAEFMADARGLEFMLDAMLHRGYDLALSYWGADYFFSCISIVERAVSIIRTGEVSTMVSSTHPPSEMRRESLRQIMKNSVPPETYGPPLELADGLCLILDKLWEKCVPGLQSLHKRGTPVAPAFSQ
ncbi:MAG: hypothetical protein JSS66_02815 [Armatimonadetes bacterium]|nr:hypothetical protein [Armatimonadota bacterium]